MISIALLYDLGPDSDRGAVWMCVCTIQAIFVLCYTNVDNYGWK
jgi:hypothetical protein